METPRTYEMVYFTAIDPKDGKAYTRKSLKPSGTYKFAGFATSIPWRTDAEGKRYVRYSATERGAWNLVNKRYYTNQAVVPVTEVVKTVTRKAVA